VGGGIRSVAERAAFCWPAADKVSINTAAVAPSRTDHRVSLEFGPQQATVLAIDARRKGGASGSSTRGEGRDPEPLRRIEWAAQGEALGAGEFLLTSMDTDGVQTGFDCELTRAVSRGHQHPHHCVRRCGQARDFVEVLTQRRSRCALAASIFHYGTYTVEDLKQFLDAHGVPVRRLA
jgi:cyclase